MGLSEQSDMGVSSALMPPPRRPTPNWSWGMAGGKGTEAGMSLESQELELTSQEVEGLPLPLEFVFVCWVCRIESVAVEAVLLVGMERVSVCVASILIGDGAALFAQNLVTGQN
jgi:hypothetical protein